MGALFKTPKVTVPKAADPPPTPTIDEGARQRTETNRVRRRSGLRGNLYAGALGVTTAQPPAGGKTTTGGM